MEMKISMKVIIVRTDGKFELIDKEECKGFNGSESFGEVRNVGNMRVTYVVYNKTHSENEPLNVLSNLLIYDGGCACCYQNPFNTHLHTPSHAGDIYISKHQKIGKSPVVDSSCNEEDIQFISFVLEKRRKYIGSRKEHVDI